MQIAENMRIPF